MSETVPQPVKGFDSLGLSPNLLSILEKAALTVPTPIQEEAIPVALLGNDIIGIAQTGTGKTLAFTVPIIEKLFAQRGKALVIVPTRELALQVEESIRKISRFMNPSIRTVCLIGGMPMFRQVKDLRTNPRIIIATPGRLQDHMNQATVNLSDVLTIVLDEADRMLDMGFAPAIKAILSEVPTDRQTMLFSATMAAEISRLAATYMHNPVRIEVATQGTSSAHIKQELCYVEQHAKSDLLQTFLKNHEGPVLVFSRTKHGATKLARRVEEMGYTASEIHSNRSLSQRRAALDGFKSGKYRVLVATDVAARGIDVQNISLVVNYDLPDAAEDYVHRIGRTGRAGKSGMAVSFATHDQARDVKNIERLINKPVPLSEHSETPRTDSRGGSSYGSFRPSARPQGAGAWKSRSPQRSSSGGSSFRRGR